MGNQDSLENWPMIEVMFMPEGDYDHYPALVKSYSYEQRRKPFR